MANDDEGLKKEVARISEEYEAGIPRLAQLEAAVVDILDRNHASAPEVMAVCLNLVLGAVSYTFGQMHADVLAEAINQALQQLNDGPSAKELVKQPRGQAKPN